MLIPESNITTSMHVDEKQNLRSVNRWDYDPQSQGLCNQKISTYTEGTADNAPIRTVYTEDLDSIKRYGRVKRFEQLNDIRTGVDALKNDQGYLEEHKTKKVGVEVTVDGNVLFSPAQYVVTSINNKRLSGIYPIKGITQKLDVKNGSFESILSINRMPRTSLRKQNRSLINFSRNPYTTTTKKDYSIREYYAYTSTHPKTTEPPLLKDLPNPHHLQSPENVPYLEQNTLETIPTPRLDTTTQQSVETTLETEEVKDTNTKDESKETSPHYRPKEPKIDSILPLAESSTSNRTFALLSNIKSSLSHLNTISSLFYQHSRPIMIGLGASLLYHLHKPLINGICFIGKLIYLIPYSIVTTVYSLVKWALTTLINIIILTGKTILNIFTVIGTSLIKIIVLPFRLLKIGINRLSIGIKHLGVRVTGMILLIVHLIVIFFKYTLIIGGIGAIIAGVSYGLYKLYQSRSIYTTESPMVSDEHTDATPPTVEVRTDSDIQEPFKTAVNNNEESGIPPSSETATPIMLIRVDSETQEVAIPKSLVYVRKSPYISINEYYSMWNRINNWKAKNGNVDPNYVTNVKDQAGKSHKVFKNIYMAMYRSVLKYEQENNGAHPDYVGLN